MSKIQRIIEKGHEHQPLWLVLVPFYAISPSSDRHACMSGHLMGKYSEQLCCELCDIANRVGGSFPLLDS